MNSAEIAALHIGEDTFVFLGTTFKSASSSRETLRFDVQTSQKCNRIEVTRTPNGTYDVDFIRAVRTAIDLAPLLTHEEVSVHIRRGVAFTDLKAVILCTLLY